MLTGDPATTLRSIEVIARSALKDDGSSEVELRRALAQIMALAEAEGVASEQAVAAAADAWCERSFEETTAYLTEEDEGEGSSSPRRSSMAVSFSEVFSTNDSVEEEEERSFSSSSTATASTAAAVASSVRLERTPAKLFEGWGQFEGEGDNYPSTVKKYPSTVKQKKGTGAPVTELRQAAPDWPLFDFDDNVPDSSSSKRRSLRTPLAKLDMNKEQESAAAKAHSPPPSSARGGTVRRSRRTPETKRRTSTIAPLMSTTPRRGDDDDDATRLAAAVVLETPTLQEEASVPEPARLSATPIVVPETPVAPPSSSSGDGGLFSSLLRSVCSSAPPATPTEEEAPAVAPSVGVQWRSPLEEAEESSENKTPMRTSFSVAAEEEEEKDEAESFSSSVPDDLGSTASTRSESSSDTASHLTSGGEAPARVVQWNDKTPIIRKTSFSAAAIDGEESFSLFEPGPSPHFPHSETEAASLLTPPPYQEEQEEEEKTGDDASSLATVTTQEAAPPPTDREEETGEDISSLVMMTQQAAPPPPPPPSHQEKTGEEVSSLAMTPEAAPSAEQEEEFMVVEEVASGGRRQQSRRRSMRIAAGPRVPLHEASTEEEEDDYNKSRRRRSVKGGGEPPKVANNAIKGKGASAKRQRRRSSRLSREDVERAISEEEETEAIVEATKQASRRRRTLGVGLLVPSPPTDDGGDDFDDDGEEEDVISPITPMNLPTSSPIFLASPVEEEQHEGEVTPGARAISAALESLALVPNEAVSAWLEAVKKAESTQRRHSSVRATQARVRFADDFSAWSPPSETIGGSEVECTELSRALQDLLGKQQTLVAADREGSAAIAEALLAIADNDNTPVAKAARLYAAEMAAALNGATSHLSLRLSELSSSLVRFHLRSLLNPPPPPVSTERSLAKARRSLQQTKKQKKPCSLVHANVKLARQSTLGEFEYEESTTREASLASLLADALEHCRPEEDDEEPPFVKGGTAEQRSESLLRRVAALKAQLERSSGRRFAANLLSDPRVNASVAQCGGWVDLEAAAAALPNANRYSQLAELHSLRRSLADLRPRDECRRKKALAELRRHARRETSFDEVFQSAVKTRRRDKGKRQLLDNLVNAAQDALRADELFPVIVPNN